MKPPPAYDTTITHPLVTSDDIVERATVLFGTAIRRQLWLLFVDSHDVQLPLLLPVDGIPVRPSGDASRMLGWMLSKALDTIDAAGVIVVLERFASGEAQNSDREWTMAVRDAVVEAGLAFRGAVICHSSGTRWFESREYGD